MGNKDLSLKPHDIDKNTWWYEEPAGIHIVHREGDGGNTTAVHLVIRWESVKAALKRKMIKSS